MKIRHLLLSSLLATTTLFMGMSSAVAAETKDYEFIDLQGNSSKLSDYRGKWVIVNLWATWCPPCLVEIPDLIMFQDENKERAVVLGVSYENLENDKVKAFAESQMINYPVVKFPGRVDGRTTPFGDLKGLPTTYMVTPDGEVVAARTGMVDQKMLESFMEKFSAMKPQKTEK